MIESLEDCPKCGINDIHTCNYCLKETCNGCSAHTFECLVCKHKVCDICTAVCWCQDLRVVCYFCMHKYKIECMECGKMKTVDFFHNDQDEYICYDCGDVVLCNECKSSTNE